MPQVANFKKVTKNDFFSSKLETFSKDVILADQNDYTPKTGVLRLLCNFEILLLLKFLKMLFFNFFTKILLFLKKNYINLHQMANETHTQSLWAQKQIFWGKI